MFSKIHQIRISNIKIRSKFKISNTNVQNKNHHFVSSRAKSRDLCSHALESRQKNIMFCPQIKLYVFPFAVSIQIRRVFMLRIQRSFDCAACGCYAQDDTFLRFALILDDSWHLQKLT